MDCSIDYDEDCGGRDQDEGRAAARSMNFKNFKKRKQKESGKQTSIKNAFMGGSSQKGGKKGGKKQQNPEDTGPSQFGYKPPSDDIYPELGKETDASQGKNGYAKKKASWYKYNKVYEMKRKQEGGYTQQPKAKYHSASQFSLKSSGIGADGKISDIRLTSGRRRKQFDPNGDNEEFEDLVVDSFEGQSQTSKRGRKKAFTQNYGRDDDDIRMADSQSEVPDTITFTNTTTYGRVLGTPSIQTQNEEEPEQVKYVKGYGSVKGLHYRKHIALELLSEHSFACHFRKFFSNEMKNLIRQISAAKFDVDLRVWVISLLNYEKLMQQLKVICNTNNIHIEDVPQFAINLMKTQIPYSLCNQRKSKYDYKSDKTIRLKLEEFLTPFIFKTLYTFQREGIKKGLKLYGRILINDEFGLGKSLQALGLALAYKNEWPLLIICPKFAQFMWRYEILKWLPGYDIKKIQIIQNESQQFDQKYQIIIMSYELAAKLHYKIEDFKIKVCIVDEVQYFRARNTPNGMVLTDLISQMKRCILLTGANLVRKPHEMYTIMKIIRSDLMPSFYEYGYRYCDPRQSFDGIDFTNSGNMYELKKLLEIRIQSISKRRGNQEELPGRMRQKLEVFADVQMVVKMQGLIQSYVVPWEVHNPDQSFFEHMFANMYPYPTPENIKFLCDPTDESKLSCQKSLKQIFRDLYDYSGTAKLKAVQDIIDNLLENNMRLIIFGFHLSFITSIEDHLHKKAKFLYIGKNVDEDYKLGICDTFNTQEEFRAVLIDLSEDISNIKFNTTNAVILFAEVYWNSQLISLAENIIEDENMKPTNNVIYVFGRYTVDEFIYKMLYRQNPSLYQDLEPLQLDLEQMRIQGSLGQNYDEQGSTQLNWGNSQMQSYSQMINTQSQQLNRQEFMSLDPLAPLRVFEAGANTLENLFNKQQVNAKLNIENLKPKKDDFDSEICDSPQRGRRYSGAFDGELSDGEDDEKTHMVVTGFEKVQDKEDIQDIDNLDDDQLAEILSQ